MYIYVYIALGCIGCISRPCMVVKKWLPRHSNFFANAVISELKASAYGIDCKVKPRLLASDFRFKHLPHMSLAFCKGVRGSCSSGVFFLGCFLGGSSARGVPGADAGVVGLVVLLSDGAGLLAVVFGGPILANTVKTSQPITCTDSTHEII